MSRPCKKCGSTDRSEKDNSCIPCKAARGKIYRANNKEKEAARVSKWQNENRDKYNAYMRGYIAENREVFRSRSRKWYADHTEAELERRKIYCQNNKVLVNAQASKYRANKLRAIPAWVDMKAIKEFYVNCPNGYVVDHIVPLKGKNVSGLHILTNLQYLTQSENCQKANNHI